MHTAISAAPNSHIASRSITRTFLLVIAALIMSISLSGCEFLEEVATAPRIANMSITPNTLHLSEVGMTDEFFTVTITVANFDDEILDAEVYIQTPHTPAAPREMVIDGNVIIMSGIAKTWFTGLSAGTYNIGAEVTSETANVRQNNLATVTVSE